MRERRPVDWGDALWLLVFALLVFGCGTARRGEPFHGPPALTEEQRFGETIFMEHCNRCHPGGEAGLGPALNNKPIPEAAIRLQVRNGYGSMPAFPEEEISEEQLDALALYVAALRGIK